MRQPDHYQSTEVFRVYAGKAEYLEPKDVPGHDGRSVVILTRRTNLEGDGGPKGLMESIRAGRKFSRRIEVGRAIVVYLFDPELK